MRRFGIGFVCLIAATAAWAQALAPAAAPPPIPQKQPMGIRPIRIPQLAPIQPVQTGPAVQPPWAPPEQVQIARPAFSPPGVASRPGFPVPGQPLQPVHPGQHQPATTFYPQQPVAVPAYQPTVPTQPAHYLTWDAERKEANAQPGQASVPFTFWLTNVSTEVVAVNSVRTSCGCTVAQLPAQPWRLEPGSNGPIQVTMHVAGKMGSIEKGVTIDSTAGYKTLIVKVNVPTQPNAQAPSGGFDPDRLKNMQMALADRQVVFKGECAKCHSEPAQGKSGEQLYVAACGICHDSTHRAAMVPDLKNLRHPTNEEHWRKWTRSGRVGSMMPAFAKAEGGPLTDEQIDSLVKFLTDSITAKAAPQTNPVATSAQVKASQSARPDSVRTLPLQKAKIQ